MSEPKTQDEGKEKLYSHHVFLFPFKWLPKKGNSLFVEQTELSRLDKYFSPKSSGWRRDPYQLDKPAKYNEYNYFYDYVREALYDTHNSLLHDHESGAENLLRHYRYDVEPEEGSYEITIPQKEGGETYHLKIDSILLQFYDTGAGILSFHLLNRDPAKCKQDDILKINQFGRRIFPPFFQIPQKLVGDQGYFDYAEKWEPPIDSELAVKINLKINGKETFEEDWRQYEKSENLKKNPFLLPRFIGGLLPDAFVKAYSIVPVLDDRMFVVCWYGNDELTGEMYRQRNSQKESGGDGKDDPPVAGYLLHPWWYKFVFVDSKDPSCQNEAMQAELVGQVTNARWANYGTFYGVTDYSFVLLTGSLDHLKKPYVNAAFLVPHLQTMYYKLVELVLLQRAAVQRFSDEVTHISRLDTNEDYAAVSKRVGSLYRQYIRFVNKIYFREATAQVQGVELYRLLQQQCRIDKQVKDLDGEIQELHNYVLQGSEAQRGKRLEQLTLLGTILLPPSLIVGLYGVSILNEVNEVCELEVLWLLFFLLLFSGLFSWRAYKSKARLAKWAFSILLGIVMAAAIFSPIYYVGRERCNPEPPPTEAELPLIREQLQSIQEQLKSLPPPLPAEEDTAKTIQDEQ
jgi:hypothetical protein